MFFYISPDINPSSSEPTNCALDDAEWSMLYSRGNSTEPFGYADKSLRRHFLKGVPINKYMLSYHYLVVIGGVGSADRLNTFLAHSGAVILLQETDFLYHYSAFLRPWVHYGKLT
jgi:hypothetical protein